MSCDIAFALGIRQHNVIGPGPGSVASEEIQRQDKHLYAGNNELYRGVGSGGVIRSNPVSHVSITEIDTGAIN
jgi:hypothetical protein